MFVKEVTVTTEVGLYARVATYFIQKANEFGSSVWIEKDERRVNAKSLLGVLSLGVSGGATIRVIADGEDEELAVNALVDLINRGFDSNIIPPASYEAPTMVESDPSLSFVNDSPSLGTVPEIPAVDNLQTKSDFSTAYRE